MRLSDSPIPRHNLDNYLEAYIAFSRDIKRSKGAAVPHYARPIRGDDRQYSAPVRCLEDDTTASAGGRHRETEIGCHTFRATGITAYLKNGGKLEIAQQMAAHESARTTGLCDRRDDEVSLGEVERIGI
jgi:integrase/recombinase XerD